MSNLETRKFALELAVRLVSIGNWRDSQHRVDVAMSIADQFVKHLDPPPEAHTQAQALRA